ncbi:hypothetical protein F0562_032510 [Nyssa sinensis]|uniref:Leucine-rich repeat-containing N-terminal plant-type domain-containing protein n=1 Tax=Nyssa sinensis TaxID=561372 RepID=A0A5J5AP97_9ASTE|nr:hypothetical protein F0562_032510 [Nyssa sinensis]
MSSCKLGPKFPHWLQTQRHVGLLFMSNANISDTIPEWFEDVFSDTNSLDLSYNQISSKLPKFPSDTYKFDLSNNLLSGNIPQIDDNTTLVLYNLLLSNNVLTGAIPEYLCKINALVVIDLSRNQLSGGIPSCLGNLQWLKVLDLGNNSLEGNIPSSLGSLQGLESLHLHNNRFHGKLPSSLQKLTNLMVLDLGKNDLADIIPHWIGEKLSNLKFLNLKSNKFNGGIPIELCHLSALQLLDLAQNYITGHIPHCFGNFTAMIVNDLNDDWLLIAYAEHEENILDSMKGRELEYTETVLPYLTSIDLSNNYIVGEIPEELMDLSGLLNLNLAGNNLKGRIPKEIGNLEQLETLDLSRNKLSGPGFLVGFLGVCGILHFQKSWRYAFFQLVDNIYNRLVVAIELKATWMQRKFRKGEFRE